MKPIASTLTALSILVLASLLGGCASSTAPHAENGRGAAQNCSQSIKEYCASRACSTYDQDVAKAHAMKASPPVGYPWSYRVGTCGSLRFVGFQEGMGVGTDYFDASGALVAKSGVADAQVCGGEFSWNAGGTPSCEEHVLERDGGSPP